MDLVADDLERRRVRALAERSDERVGARDVRRGGHGVYRSLLALLLLCAATAAHADEAKVVAIVNHGWHVGLAVRRADVTPALWPESGAFGSVRFLEVGWGDGEYYPAADVTPAMALRA